MPRIPDGLDRWKFYKTRAHKFSPYFPEGSNITYQSVAKLIPSDPQSALPATADENYITSAAVQSWLANALPDDRTGQWEKLTEIEISLWTGDRDAFERGVRRKAGEVLGWQDLVEGRAVEGVIRVKVADRQAGTRFVPEGAVPDNVPSVQLVWPGCIAWIEVPTHPPPAEPQDRRAWMFADYGHDIYTLDPLLPDAGPGPSSRLDQSLWQRDGRGGGHVVLPRGQPGRVEMPLAVTLGTRFKVLVLVVNLVVADPEIVNMFDGFEKKLRVRHQEVTTPAYQRTVRAVLNEAATLIGTKDIRYLLYRQTCEVVSRETAMNG